MRKLVGPSVFDNCSGWWEYRLSSKRFYLLLSSPSCATDATVAPRYDPFCPGSRTGPGH
jgi:hypothetical protein